MNATCRCCCCKVITLCVPSHAVASWQSQGSGNAVVLVLQAHSVCQAVMTEVRVETCHSCASKVLRTSFTRPHIPIVVTITRVRSLGRYLLPKLMSAGACCGSLDKPLSWLYCCPAGCVQINYVEREVADTNAGWLLQEDAVAGKIPGLHAMRDQVRLQQLLSSYHEPVSLLVCGILLSNKRACHEAHWTVSDTGVQRRPHSQGPQAACLALVRGCFCQR